MHINKFQLVQLSKVLTILFFFITIFSIKSNAQVFDSLLNIYEEDYPREKIHIHSQVIDLYSKTCELYNSFKKIYPTIEVLINKKIIYDRASYNAYLYDYILKNNK